MTVSETQIEAGGRAIDPAAFEQDEHGNWLQSADRDRALKASRAALTAALSDQVVVAKPTEKMVLAGGDVLLAACSSEKGNLRPWKPFDVAQVAIKVWRAMNDAAPPPSSTAGGGE